MIHDINVLDRVSNSYLFISLFAVGLQFLQLVKHMTVFTFGEFFAMDSLGRLQSHASIVLGDLEFQEAKDFDVKGPSVWLS